MILCENLVKDYPKQRTFRDVLRYPLARPQQRVLDGINLQVGNGELVGLLGANGTGKTTLLKIIGSLIQATAGRVEVMGRDAWKQSEHVKELVGFVFCDNRSFYLRLTGRENLIFFAALQRCYGRTADNRVSEVLQVVDLEHVASKAYMHYSTGMRQRLSVARALLSNPPLMLMDEPTNGMDPVTTRKIWAFIRTQLIGQGRTVLLATNRMEEAEALCDKVVVLEKGKCSFYGTIDEIGAQARLGRSYEVLIEGPNKGCVEALATLGRVRECSYRDGQGRFLLEIETERTDWDLYDVTCAVRERGGRLLSCKLNKLSVADLLDLIG